MSRQSYYNLKRKTVNFVKKRNFTCKRHRWKGPFLSLLPLIKVLSPTTLTIKPQYGDTNENIIALNTYRTKKIELFESVGFINRQHDCSYIFWPYIIIHNVEVEYCDSKCERIYETWQDNGTYIWYLTDRKFITYFIMIQKTAAD